MEGQRGSGTAAQFLQLRFSGGATVVAENLSHNRIREDLGAALGARMRERPPMVFDSAQIEGELFHQYPFRLGV